MTKARAGALIALAAAVVVVGVLVFRSQGSDDYKLVAELDNAGQLIPGNDVRIGAVKVGKITDVGLSEQSTAEVEMEIDDEHAPLGQGTVATIRATSIIGLANRYLTLDPPPGDPQMLESGDTINLADTVSPVEIDAVLDALDPKTRKGLQAMISGGATAYSGRSDETKRALRLLAPALTGTTGVMQQLAKDQASFQSMIDYGATVTTAVNSRRDDLVNLISNANVTTQAIGNQATQLERALAALPGTLRRGNTLFVKYRTALDDIDPFVAAAKPATRDLDTWLRRLQPSTNLSREVVPLTADAVALPGKANDLNNLLGRFPKFATTGEYTYPNLITFFDDSAEFNGQLRAYTPDLLAAVSNLGQVSSYYDIHGHYARGYPVMGALTWNSGLNQIDPKDPANRLGDFELGSNRRCPGGAMPPPPDGSAPLPIAGCDPTTTPPGP